MYRILCFSLVIFYLVRIATSTIEIGNTSRTTNHIKMHRTTKYWKLRYHRPTGPEGAHKVISLHSDVVKFLATYVKRETFETTTTAYEQKSKRGSYRPRNFTQSTKSTTRAIYYTKRTYPPRKVRREILEARLVNMFSEFDDEKKAFFTSSDIPPPSKASTCYMDAYSCFMNHCYYDHYYKNTGMKEMKTILARACMASWLSTKKIIHIMENCCGKRFKFVPVYSVP